MTDVACLLSARLIFDFASLLSNAFDDKCDCTMEVFENHLVLDGWNRRAHCASEALLKFKINQIRFTSCSVFHQKNPKTDSILFSEHQAHLLPLLSPRFLILSFYFPPNMSCSSQLTSCSPYWLSYVPCKQALLLFKENDLCLQINR